MKLLYTISKFIFLDIFCPLSDVNDYPILTHTVALFV